MGEGAGSGINPSDRFTIDGVEFVPSWDRPSEPGSLTLLKSAGMVERYTQLLERFTSPNLVELGISQGGSVALLALLARPKRMVAVELDDNPIEPLLRVLAEQGLEDSVRPYFGVDQADAVRLTEIIADEFGSEPLDVVIDDASHQYDLSVASFEILFPLVRPGGLYVIEDWTWLDLWSASLVRAMEDSPAARELMATTVSERDAEGAGASRPLSRLALELVLARARSGDAVADVSVDEDWIVVRRGPEPIDPSSFRLTDLYTDPFGLLADR